MNPRKYHSHIQDSSCGLRWCHKGGNDLMRLKWDNLAFRPHHCNQCRVTSSLSRHCWKVDEASTSPSRPAIQKSNVSKPLGEYPGNPWPRGMSGCSFSNFSYSYLIASSLASRRRTAGCLCTSWFNSRWREPSMTYLMNWQLLSP